MNQSKTIKGRIVHRVAQLAVAGPWRSTSEALTCVVGRKFPTNKLVLSFCRHLGSQLLEREGADFKRVANFTSGGRMYCSGLSGISTTSLMYYFLGTINGQTEDERPMEKLLLHAVRNGDTFLDIGANYGFYSFLLGPLCGKSGSVHAFEANPVLREHLVQSADLNRSKANIIVNTVAVGSAGRSEVVLYDPEHIGCSSLHQHEWVNTGASVSVRQITIDDYRRQNNIERIDLVKIDIEGAELDAFRGMQETFEICPPSLIVCELMPLLNMNTDDDSSLADMRRAPSAPSPIEIVDFLSSKGYEARYIRNSDGRLAEVVRRDHLEQLSRKVINVCFVRHDLKASRPDLFIAA